LWILLRGTTLSRSRSFTAIYTSVAIGYLGVGLVAPLIAIVLSSRGADSFVVGLVGTTMFAAFTVASFPIGAATDRFGPRLVLISGLVVYGTSVLLFALIQSTGLFFAVRASEGIGGAAISIATETMISQMSGPGERARRMSYYALAVGVGWAAGPIAGTALYASRPELPFFACFVLSVAAAILVGIWIPRTPSTPHSVEGLLNALKVEMAEPISAGALYGYLMSSFITLSPLYFREIHVGMAAMGSIITAVIVGTILSQVPLGRAADRYGKRLVLILASAGLSVTFAVMPLQSNWRLFLVTGAIIGGLAGSLYPVGLSMIGGIVGPKRLGAGTSLFSLSFGLGSLIGPAASGFAMRHLGGSWLFFIAALLSLAFGIELVVFSSVRALSGRYQR
jgi:MFS family permease